MIPSMTDINQSQCFHRAVREDEGLMIHRQQGPLCAASQTLITRLIGFNNESLTDCPSASAPALLSLSNRHTGEISQFQHLIPASMCTCQPLSETLSSQ